MISLEFIHSLKYVLSSVCQAVGIQVSCNYLTINFNKKKKCLIPNELSSLNLKDSCIPSLIQ